MNKVTYKCQDKECSKSFEVEQGSRRKYCDDCAIKRLLHKERKKRK
jgi:DNA-directed RNA polymerase subunit RPC12/RpoP